jgi:hypothetical protein
MKMSELKACPFCGSISDKHDSGDYHIFHQPGCFLFDINWIGSSKTSRWNRRAPSPAVARLIKASVAMVDWLQSRSVQFKFKYASPVWEELVDASDALKAVEGEQ